MRAKNHLLIFSSFLDIWENVEWPRFLDHPVDWAGEWVDVLVQIERAKVGILHRQSTDYRIGKMWEPAQYVALERHAHISLRQMGKFQIRNVQLWSSTKVCIIGDKCPTRPSYNRSKSLRYCMSNIKQCLITVENAVITILGSRGGGQIKR